MSGPAYHDCTVLAASTPLRAAFGGGLRPALTAPARGALRKSGRDEETPLSRTKHRCNHGFAFLQNLTHTTVFGRPLSLGRGTG